MAKTIAEIQTLIDGKTLDARQLINLIVDYLHSNSGSGGSDTVLYKKVRLTNAQIKSLPSTQIELIAAPGAGKAIIILAASSFFYSEGGYTGVTNASWILKDDVYITGPMRMENVLSSGGGSFRSYFPIPISIPGSGSFANQIVTNSASFSSGNNLPIVITDDWEGLADYGGGNDNNFADIRLFYSIYDTE